MPPCKITNHAPAQSAVRPITNIRPFPGLTIQALEAVGISAEKQEEILAVIHEKTDEVNGKK